VIWVKIKVKYHHDGEIRKYAGEKFKLLKDECTHFKNQLGVEAKIIGKLSTRYLYQNI
jgi:hypothetical protein